MFFNLTNHKFSFNESGQLVSSLPEGKTLDEALPALCFSLDLLPRLGKPSGILRAANPDIS